MIRRTLLLAGDRRLAFRYLALLGLGSVVRAGAVLTLVPLLSALLSADPGTAMPWIGALAGLVALGWLVDYRAAGAGFAIGFVLLSSVESKIVDRLQGVPLGWLTADRRAAAHRSLTSTGREMVQGIAYLLTPSVNALTTPAFIGVGLVFVAWPLGVVALAAVPVVMAALWASGRCVRAADAAYDAAGEEVGERIVELAQAQPALRAAGRAGADGSLVGGALNRQRSAAMRLIGFGLPGQLLFGFATQAALLGLVATAVALGLSPSLATAAGLDGTLGAAEVVALIIVAVRFVEPFTTLAEIAPAVETARGTLARLHTLLQAPVLGRAGAAAVPDEHAPALELREVSFGYEPGQEVLSGVSLTVARGTTTAIVGPSGSGKSTLLSLVARFHEVSGGSVLVAGHDVRDYDPGALMARLGIVFQDVYLFDATLRENVLLGDPGAGDDRLAAAAAAAQLDEVVRRLPDGWATRVGERGAALSGGERQRVSIARALLKDAPLLLLDEATAALDTGNERAIVAALESSGRERATVIVAHRLSTIARADRIVFLEGGRIAESGTLEELLALDGRFAAYWRRRERAAGWTLTASA
ncbi:ABC transporter ATP-binding protein [Nonomuraea soli]|uniref:ATP-binding cassette subfamily B protein IrtB n=1 Tax=Nonomuraea soli TaxID=1032476 RepID=A0A7W0HPN3_9ACTN|nr:ABC transporter ATP-binding protein/permease [Nonomuraea soli]MBA2890932.1 ATP-binding cassette subfamily B protein IrtB [Nonomuraea soli]